MQKTTQETQIPAFSRRDFLKTSTAATLAVAAGAKPLFAAEEPLKVGVIQLV